MALRDIVALLGLALLASPALAQTPQPPAIKSPADLNDEQMEELYCVYDAVLDDKDARAVEDWAISADETLGKKAVPAFARAKAACAAKHKWSSQQVVSASMVALEAIGADVREGELRAKGFDDRKLEAIMQASRKLSEADADSLMNIFVKPDEALVRRVKALLYEAGVPKEGGSADLAFAFVQSSLQEYTMINSWIGMKLY